MNTPTENPMQPQELSVMGSDADSGIAIQAIAIKSLKERVEVIHQVMRECMEKDEHYGTIPGTRKPSLYKTGAELICTLFQLGTRYPKDSLLIEREDGHFRFTLTCQLFHIPTGRTVGEGIGAATTAEYRYRIQCEDRVGQNGQTIKAKFTPHDLYNNVLKIAKKRAMVDAVLTATGASKIWTQDTEDNPELYKEGDQKPEKRDHKMKPANGSAPQRWRGKLEKVTEKSWSKGKEGEPGYKSGTFWILKIDDRECATFSETDYLAATDAIGAEVEVTVEPGQRQGSWKATRFLVHDDLPDNEATPESE
jgi:hypothetical protein